MSHGFYYLSNPYNGSKEHMQERADMACLATTLFLRKGIYIISPVVHNHPVIQHFTELTPDQRRQLFMPYDLELLRAAKGMIILKLDGWKESKGIREEIGFARQNQKPIYETTLTELQQDKFEWKQFKEVS